MVCTIGYSVLSIFIKVVIYSRSVGFPAWDYFSGVILPDLVVMVVSLALIVPCYWLFDLASIPILLAVVFYAFCISALVGLFIGCSQDERLALWETVKAKTGSGE